MTPGTGQRDRRVATCFPSSTPLPESGNDPRQQPGSGAGSRPAPTDTPSTATRTGDGTRDRGDGTHAPRNPGSGSRMTTRNRVVFSPGHPRFPKRKNGGRGCPEKNPARVMSTTLRRGGDGCRLELDHSSQPASVSCVSYSARAAAFDVFPRAAAQRAMNGAGSIPSANVRRIAFPLFW